MRSRVDVPSVAHERSFLEELDPDERTDLCIGVQALALASFQHDATVAAGLLARAHAAERAADACRSALFRAGLPAPLVNLNGVVIGAEDRHGNLLPHQPSPSRSPSPSSSWGRFLSQDLGGFEQELAPLDGQWSNASQTARAWSPRVHSQSAQTSHLGPPRPDVARSTTAASSAAAGPAVDVHHRLDALQPSASSPSATLRRAGPSSAAGSAGSVPSRESAHSAYSLDQRRRRSRSTRSPSSHSSDSARAGDAAAFERAAESSAHEPLALQGRLRASSSSAFRRGEGRDEDVDSTARKTQARAASQSGELAKTDVDDEEHHDDKVRLSPSPSLAPSSHALQLADVYATYVPQDSTTGSLAARSSPSPQHSLSSSSSTQRHRAPSRTPSLASSTAPPMGAPSASVGRSFSDARAGSQLAHEPARPPVEDLEPEPGVGDDEAHAAAHAARASGGRAKGQGGASVNRHEKLAERDDLKLDEEDDEVRLHPR